MASVEPVNPADPGETNLERSRAARRALLGISGSQLLVLTLWFSASAVAPQLQDQFDLTTGQAAGLTLAVQIGFVVGALGLAVLNVPDIVPSRRLFLIATIAGAGSNALLLAVAGTYPAAFALRVATGIALAGVYPAGLKVMAGWFRRSRGMALGVLVGALTVGSAGPHLIRGIGFEWQGVVIGASLLALLGGILMAVLVTDGPYDTAKQRFSWHQVGRVVLNPGFRLSTYGYLGHMWELYAMWTWTAAFLAASAASSSSGYPDISVITFFVIAIGGLGAWLAGIWGDRFGRTVVAGGSLAISGTCAVLTPLVFGATAWAVVPLFLLWGFSVVADSAQFSTMVTETSDDQVRGTALAVQTAVGFLLTLVTIRGVPVLAEAWGWQWAFPVLAVGPVLGIAAMVRLRRSRYAAMLAGGAG